jgi:hypothetical protein
LPEKYGGKLSNNAWYAIDVAYATVADSVHPVDGITLYCKKFLISMIVSRKVLVRNSWETG